VATPVGGEGGDVPAGEVKPTPDAGLLPTPAAEPDPIQELRRQLDALNRDKEEADRRAAQEREGRLKAEDYALRASDDVVNTRGTLTMTQLQSIENALSAAKLDGEAAEQAYQQAFAANDGVAMAKAQRAMARAEADIREMERNHARTKEVLDQQVAEAKTHRATIAERQQRVAAEAKAPPPTTSSDPAEQIMSQLTARTQNFLKSNPARASWIQSETQFDKLKGAHFLAKGEGFIPDSDAYFDRLDQIMGAKPAPTNGNAQVTDAQQTRKTPYAAPTSRGADSPQTQVNKVRMNLSPSQRETARAMNLSDNEYALRIHTMKEQMKDPNYRGPRFDPV
jgi:hypothetical protein